MVFCNNKACSEWDRVNKGHNPYFNRWFSAMPNNKSQKALFGCHNPYFNRWFSAIICNSSNVKQENQVTILILIDGFLQLKLQSLNRFKG